MENDHGNNAPSIPMARPIGVISVVIRRNPWLAERNVRSGNGSASASNVRRAAGTNQTRQFATIIEGANAADRDPIAMRRPPNPFGSMEKGGTACAIQ